jgi:hypothetical protein
LRLDLLFLSTLLVLSTGFVSAKETAATSQSNALAGTGLEALIDKATSRVLQKYKGKVPADVKTKVLGEINKLTGSKSKAAAAALRLQVQVLIQLLQMPLRQMHKGN